MLDQVQGDEPMEMFLGFVDGKEDCMAQYLIKEAQRSLQQDRDGDISESWNEIPKSFEEGVD